MSAANVQFFFNLRDQIHLYHWQTKSYSRHKATDEVIESLIKAADKYVETYMGKYGRPKVTAKTNTIKLSNLSETSIIRFIKNAMAYLMTVLPRGIRDTDTDLINIRDEMLGQLNQLMYFFTLQ